MPMIRSSVLISFGLHLFSVISAFSAVPPVGTYYVAHYGSGGPIFAFEEGSSCVDHISNFTIALGRIRNVVPVYVTAQPGVVRMFVLGSVASANELWLGQDTPRLSRKIAIDEPVSVTPYSSNEVLVADAHGSIWIVDGHGNPTSLFSLDTIFPANYPTAEIGQILRVWRAGEHSYGILTTNNYVHIAPGNNTIIRLNVTSTAIAGAYLPSFELANLITANGDDRHVWVAHRHGSSLSTSFSLFDISNGAFLQRYTPNRLARMGVQPVYHDTRKRRGYFAVGDELVSFDRSYARLHAPGKQMAVGNLSLPVVANFTDLLVVPAVQGLPWNSNSAGWTIPPDSPRSSAKTAIIATGQQFGSRITRSLKTPAGPATSPSIATAPAASSATVTTEKRELFGEARTKTELTTYLTQELALAIRGGKIDSLELVRNLGGLNAELRTAIIGLPDAFLNARGLEYFQMTVISRSAQTSDLSDWVDAFWK